MSHVTPETNGTADAGALVRRRQVLRAGATLGLAAVGAVGLSSSASASVPARPEPEAADPAERDVILVGANPGLTLFDGDAVTAYASVWQVDWSERGAGTAIVLWHDARVEIHTDRPALGRYLESYYTRHFPEVDGLPWPEPVVHRVPAHVDIDLDRGVRAHAGDLRVHLDGVLDRRAFATDEFPLADGVDHSLSLVTGPCSRGWITRRGRRLPGDVVVGGTPQRPSSTAFVAVAEVWRR